MQRVPVSGRIGGRSDGEPQRAFRKVFPTGYASVNSLLLSLSTQSGLRTYQLCLLSGLQDASDGNFSCLSRERRTRRRVGVDWRVVPNDWACVTSRQHPLCCSILGKVTGGVLS